MEAIDDEYTPIDKIAPKCFSDVDVKIHAPFANKASHK